MYSSLFLLVALLSSPSWAFPNKYASNVPQCGVAKSHADNGYNATYPWAAAVFVNDNNINRFACTGTIIDPLHILTAAHCVHKERMITSVKVGAIDFTSAKAREYRVKEAVQHPKWNRVSNDLAVLTLEEPIEFNERIAPICVDLLDPVRIGEVATVAGWGSATSKNCYGKKGWGPENYNTVLHQGHMHVVDTEECEVSSKKSKICMRGVDAVAAAGDSGGMLMVEREGRWYQIGITSSFEADCDSPPPPQKLPEVFTSVAFYHDWILQEMKKD